LCCIYICLQCTDWQWPMGPECCCQAIWDSKENH